MPTTVRRLPSRARGFPDLEPQEGGHAVGDGNVVDSVRVVASAERQARATVRPTRVLGAELDLVDTAGNGQ